VSAGKSYDKALKRVWKLAEAPERDIANQLPVAIDKLGDSLRVYSQALRNLAAFAEAEAERPPALAHHA
jgi:hypothetical protein